MLLLLLREKRVPERQLPKWQLPEWLLAGRRLTWQDAVQRQLLLLSRRHKTLHRRMSERWSMM